MSVIADELARRSSPDYVRGRAREAAMSKASQARDRITSKPGILAAIGAATGGTLGMALAKKAKRKRQGPSTEPSEERAYAPQREYRPEGGYPEGEWASEEGGVQPGYVPQQEWGGYAAGSWSEPWRGPESEEAWRRAAQPEAQGPSRREQLQQKGAEMKERAAHKRSEMKERVSHKASALKERMSEKKGQLRGRLSEKKGEWQQRRSEHGGLRERMPSPGELGQQARRRPVGTMIGGALLGALAASLIPLSRRERKVMHPAKEQLGDQFRHLEQRVEEKMGMGGEGPQRARGEEGSQPAGAGQGVPSGAGYAAGTAPSRAPGAGGVEQRGAEFEGPPTPRSELGSSARANEPYRQPSFAEQLEESDEGGGKLH